MSLLPVLIGIIPLVIFMFVPAKYDVINTVLWASGTIGLATPANDYIDAISRFIKVPSGCKVQSGESRFYYF